MKQCMDQKYFPKRFPAQHQDCQPGIESWMEPLPVFDDPCYRGSGKLRGMTALITGRGQRDRKSGSGRFCQRGGRCRNRLI